MTQYDEARKRAKEMAEFYRHAMTYLFFISLMAVMNLAFSPDDIWFPIPALIWGFFLLKQAWCVFGAGNLFGQDWEERKTAELMGQKPKRKNADDYFEEVPAE